MKKTYFFLKNKLTSVYALVLLVLISVGSASCKKDEVSPYEDVTVQFKIETVNTVTIDAAVTQVGTAQSTNFNVTGTSWQSEPQIVNTSVGAVHIAATGKGSATNSELRVKIFVNGEQKKIATITGSGNLVAKTMLNFLE